MIRLFKTKKIRIYFLDKFTIKMRTGGSSNKNIKNILIKLLEDVSIMRKNNIKVVKSILYKNFSKISQFL